MTGSSHGELSAGASANDRIIMATLKLIAKDGLGSLTMIRIAEAAGVARQTLYNHYSDIDSIVAEAIGRHNRESIQMLEVAMRVVDGPADKLEQIVRHAVSVGAHAHHSPGIEHGLSSEARATLREYSDVLDTHIREILAAGQKDGAFRDDVLLDVDVMLIRHMLDGLAAQASSRPDDAASIATAGARSVLATVANR